MRPDPVAYPGFAAWCEEFGFDPEEPGLIWLWLDPAGNEGEVEDDWPDAMVITF